MDNGYLSDYTLFAPPTGINNDALKLRGKDYSSAAIEYEYDRPTITGDAIEHYAKHCSGAPALAFCASVTHAEHTAAEFTAAGFPFLPLTADLTDAQRTYRINALASGKLCGLTSCDIVSEGTDIPVVAVAILLRPTKSLGLYLQQVGRVLRPYPGKERAIILDHAGNSLTHGCPDEDREWDINNGDGGPKLKRCERCYKVLSVSARRCDACGYAPPVKERSIEEVAGELVQMTPDEVSALRKRARQAVGRARTLEQLLHIAGIRGYKPEWAYQVYNSRKARGRAA